MSVLKHLKMLQHVSIIIHIIFRELVGSLLKSLNLKVFISFFLNCEGAHTHTHTKRYAAVSPQITSTAHLSTQNTTHTHQTLCSRITTSNLHNFKKNL